MRGPTGGGMNSSGQAIPLGPGFWKNGGYWDFRQTPGADGASVPNTLNSLVNANAFTPSGLKPLVLDGQIGGNRAINFANTLGQYLECDALAALMSGLNTSFSLAIRFRGMQQIGILQTLLAAGNSGGAGTQFWRIQQNTSSGVVALAKSAAAGVVRSGTTNLDYNEHVLCLSVNGTVATLYLDGAIDPLDSTDMTTLALTCNRFALGAALSNAAANTWGGNIQLFAMSDQVMTGAQVTALTSAWLAQDFTEPAALQAQLGWFGDSITRGRVATNDTGFRAEVMNYILDNRLSILAVGTQAGQGQFRNNAMSAQDGADITQVLALALADIGTGNRTKIELAWFMAGTNNIDLVDGQTAAQALAIYGPALTSLHNALVAQQPNYRPIVATLPAIQNGNTGFDQWATFNAGLPAIWNAFDLAHPANATIRVDVNAALGGAWNAANYGNAQHPNDAGHLLVGKAIVTAIAPVLRALSPTLAPLAATWVPSNPITLNSQSGYPLFFRTTRSNLTAQLLVDGVPAVNQIVTTSSTRGPQSGLWTAVAYTPEDGDIGAHSLVLKVTDPLTGQVAFSAAQAVTVAAKETPLDIFGALLQWANTSISATGVAWGDQSGNAHNYAGTWTVNAVDATLNNLQTASSDGATNALTSNLTYANPTSIAPISVLGVVKIHAATANGSIVIDSAGNFQQAVTERGGQLIGAQSGAAGAASPYVLDQWARLRSDYSNQASDQFWWGNLQPVTGNAGAGAGGVTRNVAGHAAGPFFNGSYWEILYLAGLPTSGAYVYQSPLQMGRYDAYVTGRTLGAAAVLPYFPLAA